MQESDFHLDKNGHKRLSPNAVPSRNLPEHQAGLWDTDIFADVEMPEAPVADVEMPEAPQEDNPLPIEEGIAEPEHGVAPSGDAAVGNAMSDLIGSGQAQAIPKAVEKGIQTEMPSRNKATQTQKRSRDRAVQTKEAFSEREKLRAEEQRIMAFQKQVRSLKVRYI